MLDPWTLDSSKYHFDRYAAQSLSGLFRYVEFAVVGLAALSAWLAEFLDLKLYAAQFLLDGVFRVRLRDLPIHPSREIGAAAVIDDPLDAADAPLFRETQLLAHLQQDIFRVCDDPGASPVEQALLDLNEFAPSLLVERRISRCRIPLRLRCTARSDAAACHPSSTLP